MKPITIQPEMVSLLPDAYVQKSGISFIGIDGEERYPFAEKISVEDLLKLLED